MKQEKIKRFEQDYKELVDGIYRLCLYKTSDAMRAEDLVQDVFSSFFAYIKTNDYPDNPKAFVYKSARNKIIDYYRKQKTDSLEEFLEKGESVPEENHGEEFSYILAEYGLVIKTLNSLDPDQRDLLYMRLVDDMSITDISEVLQISKNHVSVKITRAKEELRKKLHHD